MKKKLKAMSRILFSRVAIVAILLLLQIVLLINWMETISQYSIFVYGGFVLITVAAVIYIINERTNPMYKLAWMIPILVIPVIGVLFYLFIQLQVGTRMLAHRVNSLATKTLPHLYQSKEVFMTLENESKQIAHLAYYLRNSGGYPVYKNSNITYFSLGEEKFEELKLQLNQAKHFIFMEYFIVEEGMMWDSILPILVKKVNEGVEVRFMYDGMCSVSLMPYGYPKFLASLGIKCKIFSPIKPMLSTYQNNRDHRKIVVIDGHTAFTGGVNLADEYINQKIRFGHWKDNAIMIKGEAVQSFTIMFLQMWNIIEKVEDDYDKYISIGHMAPKPESDGYIIPYGDSPYNKENIGEQVYMNMIYKAQDYVHIMTPYLILDNEMITALTYAAKSGVEVVIIMPHIPDKWYAFILAKTYYWELMEAGVQIYEYTPGFIHAKTFIVDGEEAVVGSINLDYRSFYLHFECGVYMYQNSVIPVIEEDYQFTLSKCQLITREDCRKLGLGKRVMGRVLRIFAPLM